MERWMNGNPGQTPESQQAVTDDVPVLISGCGPVGLMMSILLSRQGIDNIVLEKRGGVSNLPRARGITARSVEILSQLGLGPTVDAISLAPRWLQNFVYTEKLAGELVGMMPTHSMKPGALAAWSPCDYKVAAQDRIDPMLYDHAAGYPQTQIRFGAELLSYEETPDDVIANVRTGGNISRIRARYLIGADGGKSLLRQLAGIGETGRLAFNSYVNNHIRVDLERFIKGREGALIWTLAPGHEGLFQILDGQQYWAVQIQYDPKIDHPETWTEDRVRRTLRAMIGDPGADELPIEILRSYTFTLSATISERLRAGRMLLVGDAAHQVPPFGGFGLNTGIQTAHNLAWKLGCVLRGEAGDALLDSFDSERREVATRVCEFGRVNAGYIGQLMRAVRAASSTDEKREIVARSRQYGNWVGLDLGVHYEGEGAFIADDVPVPSVPDPIVDYVPHAKPGHRAPHLWVRRGDERISTVLLFDRFILLTGADGARWIHAARVMSERGLPQLTAHVVAADGDLIPEGDFCGLYGITPSGAVLVRPDGHVGFRAPGGVADPVAVLVDVFDRILCRAALKKNGSA
jgi:putative polyketide hydroxylase